MSKIFNAQGTPPGYEMEFFDGRVGHTHRLKLGRADGGGWYVSYTVSRQGGSSLKKRRNWADDADYGNADDVFAWAAALLGQRDVKTLMEEFKGDDETPKLPLMRF